MVGEGSTQRTGTGTGSGSGSGSGTSTGDRAPAALTSRIASRLARSASSHTWYVNRSAALWSIFTPPESSNSRADVTEFASQTARLTISLNL